MLRGPKKQSGVSRIFNPDPLPSTRGRPSLTLNHAEERRCWEREAGKKNHWLCGGGARIQYKSARPAQRKINPVHDGGGERPPKTPRMKALKMPQGQTRKACRGIPGWGKWPSAWEKGPGSKQWQIRWPGATYPATVAFLGRPPIEEELKIGPAFGARATERKWFAGIERKQGSRCNFHKNSKTAG